MLQRPNVAVSTSVSHPWTADRADQTILHTKKRGVFWLIGSALLLHLFYSCILCMLTLHCWVEDLGMSVNPCVQQALVQGCSRIRSLVMFGCLQRYKLFRLAHNAHPNQFMLRKQLPLSRLDT